MVVSAALLVQLCRSTVSSLLPLGTGGSALTPPPTENGKLRFQFPTRNFRLPTFAPPHGQNSCRQLTDASRAQFSVRSSLAFWEVFKDNRANQQSDPTCYCLSEKGRRQIQTEQKAYVYWKSHSPSLKSFQKE